VIFYADWLVGSAAMLAGGILRQQGTKTRE